MVDRACILHPEKNTYAGRTQLRKEILCHSKVVVCTPDMAQRKEILDLSFDLIVLDEIGIASGTDVCKGFLRHKLDRKQKDPHVHARILIAGDELQLKPFKYGLYNMLSPLEIMAESHLESTVRLTIQ